MINLDIDKLEKVAEEYGLLLTDDLINFAHDVVNDASLYETEEHEHDK